MRAAFPVLVLVAASAIGALGRAHAQVPARKPRLAVVPIRESPRLDGRLDEPVWRAAPGTDAFTQKFPDEGKPPTERTVLKVLHDGRALWVGFECEQKRSRVIARLAPRDRPVDADLVTIALDTRRNGTNAFEFGVNAAGVLYDSLRFNDTEISTDWDENWDARVHVTPQGWSAEIRIPLRILRFEENLPVQDWGMQARRTITALQEIDEWAFIPRDAAGEVSRYGRLTGLVNLRATGRVELRPFVLGRVRRRDRGQDTVAEGMDLSGSGGLDLKWHITKALTLEGAFLPDFGQVEADQVLFNLTRLELRLPEKRPFFYEGIDLFTTLVPVLYTRRIGLAPPAPSLRPGETLVQLPEVSTLYTAAKTVGTLGERLHLGVLTSLTARNDVDVQTADGRREPRVALPTSLYNVLRLKLDLPGNSHVGLIATTVHRFEQTDRYPTTTAPDGSTRVLCPDGTELAARDRCFHDAYVGAVDWRWRSPSGTYALNGQLVGNVLLYGPPRTMLDGTVIGPGDLSGGGVISFAKEGGRSWVWGVLVGLGGQKQDTNDAGFLPRQNLWGTISHLEYRTLEPWGNTLQTNTRLEVGTTNNLSAALNLERVVSLSTTIKFTNFWTLFVKGSWVFTYFDDREMGDGAAIEHAGGPLGIVSLSSDPRRSVLGQIDVVHFRRRNGYYLRLGGRLTIRPDPRWDIELFPETQYSQGEPRYYASGAPGEYLFGNLLGRSVSLTLRSTYTFTPRLSLSLYSQLFLASRHYSGFSRYRSDPGGRRPAVALDDLVPAPAPADNPDTADAALNINLVLRWEYLLGSTLFVVYSRMQSPSGTYAPGVPGGLELGLLRQGPTADVFLVKLSYFWG